ncbi:uncharacterized protein KY384_000543 [Bacidia gigantensis]|uniref:uncharacterized protein n=1 Tax=Bacidia gigantensis TaxID=2732470 RepID=UPI001D03D623|nr:uncharacterized protein KY384_000543 [Bacidia gigantensis]KAG8525783.1 hypothetical protein KY384_000543 [Bacidia gigantensis]
MRASSAKQRFPVPQWKADLEIIHDTAIKMSQKHPQKQKESTPAATRQATPVSSFTNLAALWQSRQDNNATPASGMSEQGTRTPSPSGAEMTRALSLGSRLGPGHEADHQSRGRKKLSKQRPASRDSSLPAQAMRRAFFLRSGRSSRASSVDRSTSNDLQPPPSLPTLVAPSNAPGNRVSRISENIAEDHAEHEVTGQDNPSQLDFSQQHVSTENGAERDDHDDSDRESTAEDSPTDEYILTSDQVANERDKFRVASLRRRLEENAGEGPSSVGRGGTTPSPPGTPPGENRPMITGINESQVMTDAGSAPKEPYLSLGTVLQGKKDFKLQNVQPIFDDPTGLYAEVFEHKLRKLNGKNSENTLCIEEYLRESEKDWFNRYRSVRLGRSPASSRASSIFRVELDRPDQRNVSNAGSGETRSDNDSDQFFLQENYTPPKGIRKYALRRIGTWPLYTFFLAFGQIISANSYQIVLLTGEVGQSAEKLYIVATIYLVFSIIWWLVFRKFQSKWVLSLPFLFYGLAFFILGLSPYAKSQVSRGWVQNIATGFYAAASSSGAFFFSLNFGAEGSVPVSTWSFRAAIIQGIQQLYVVLLWYWGSQLTRLTISGVRTRNLITYGPGMTAITTPIALVMFLIGTLLYIGLPDYYRQSPGHIPSFYRSLTRRRIVMWFLIAVILQNYWLSAPYGRNWTYLWNSQHAPGWAIGCLILLFFVGVWAAFLAVFAYLSKTHTWIVPIFAVGLGAPRWCQMLWGTSNMGLYIPWAGSPIAQAMVGRSLWLWLGTLDTIQGVGIGMILLQTLTRFHVTFALVSAQVLGSVATIVARASAPDANGPGRVFPNLALTLAGLKYNEFWIGCVCQLVICVGFLWWFRGEQLMKP